MTDVRAVQYRVERLTNRWKSDLTARVRIGLCGGVTEACRRRTAVLQCVAERSLEVAIVSPPHMDSVYVILGKLRSCPSCAIVPVDV